MNVLITFLTAAAFRRGVEVAALIILGYVLGRSIWHVLAPAASVASITAPAALPTLSVAQDRALIVDRSILVRENPFAPAALSSDAQLAEDVPETSLNLSLKGQRAVTGDGLGAATIVTPDNRQGVYREGDEILEGVVLSQVLPDRVILERDGQLESLFRDGRDGKLSVLGDAEPPRQTVATQDSIEASEYRIANLQSLFAYGRPERSSNPPGWRIRSVGDPSVLRSVGLMDGDELLAINGMAAAEMDFAALQRALSETDRALLSLKRGTRALSITVIFEDPQR